MLGLVGLLGNIGLLLGGQIAAKYGLKLGIIAAVLAVFAACWVAMMLIITTVSGLLPASPLTGFSLQFLPSDSVVSAGVGIVFSTMVTLRSLEFWRMSFGVTSKIAAS